MKLLKLFSLLFLALVTSCENKSDISENEPELDYQTTKDLKKQMLISGDTTAYITLRKNQLIKHPEEFYFWSVLMANTYNYHLAQYDVYTLSMEIASLYGVQHFDSLPDSTQTGLLDYLMRSAENGNSDAAYNYEKLKK